MLVPGGDGRWTATMLLAMAIRYLICGNGTLIEQASGSVELLRVSLIVGRRSLELRIMVLVHLPGVLQSYRPTAVSPLRGRKYLERRGLHGGRGGDHALLEGEAGRLLDYLELLLREYALAAALQAGHFRRVVRGEVRGDVMLLVHEVVQIVRVHLRCCHGRRVEFAICTHLDSHTVGRGRANAQRRSRILNDLPTASYVDV